MSQQRTLQQGQPAAAQGLSKRTLGVPALVFMIIAASAPLTVIAGGTPSNFAVTGVVGIPLSFIVLGACLALFAVGYSAMSAHIRNAGAFYAYIAQGLGRAAGVGAAWVALVAYNAMQIGIYGLFGFASASFIGSKIGSEIPWWATALAGFAIVGWLGVNKVDLSVKVIAVLVGLEFLAVIVFDIVALAVQPEGVSGAGMAPSNLFTAGVGAALAFSIAGFMGFESAAIYSEEAKDPKRSIARATYIAVAVISLFYAFSAWATTIATGPGQVVARSQEFGPDLLFVFLTEHAGTVIADITQVLFITSLLAALIAFHNAVARYVFSLGREGVIPRQLAYVSPRSHAPVAGSLVQSGLALLLLVVFAIAGTGSELGPLYPVLTFFTWLTNTGAFGLVLLLVLISAAVIGYFRKHGEGYSAWTKLVAPALAVASLGAVFILIVVNFNVLIGSDGLSTLSWLLPAIVVLPGLAGVGWGLHLKSSRPELYAGIGHGGFED
ncbi:amino acid permease [Arthrobacter crystallopoietes BAB-32]|uniref:Amino acid permease n=1 Tax=Arthrobacter crystallopoietes BAB-32 TaxID=1246476 RepID=N1V3U4_9MICC|nr:APC family permease [Arthrobacter crystallopoietes]EMY34689.1 amino acid permease [Arthrobacter crystallopoietes BAB-32]